MKTICKIKKALIRISLLFVFALIGFNGYSQQGIERGTITIDGVRLNYVAEGKGTPCLVIGSSVYYPRIYSQQLRKSLRLYFVDMRWYVSDKGLSPLSGYTIQSIADDIETIRKALKLKKIIIIGHSIHGDIVLDYARRYPANVSHVVAIGNPAIYGSEEANDAMLAFRKNAEPDRMETLRKNWEASRDSINELNPTDRFIQTYVTNGPLYWYDYTYDCSALWQGVEVNMDVANHLFQKLYTNYDVGASTMVIAQPVYIMLGKHDYLVPYTTWKPTYSNMPKMKLTFFEKSGHTPPFEEPEFFDQQLISWIKSNK
jgi:proline iminopeptidase